MRVDRRKNLWVWPYDTGDGKWFPGTVCDRSQHILSTSRLERQDSWRWSKGHPGFWIKWNFPKGVWWFWLILMYWKVMRWQNQHSPGPSCATLASNEPRNPGPTDGTKSLPIFLTRLSCGPRNQATARTHTLAPLKHRGVIFVIDTFYSKYAPAVQWESKVCDYAERTRNPLDVPYLGLTWALILLLHVTLTNVTMVQQIQNSICWYLLHVQSWNSQNHESLHVNPFEWWGRPCLVACYTELHYSGCRATSSCPLWNPALIMACQEYSSPTSVSWKTQAGSSNLIRRKLITKGIQQSPINVGTTMWESHAIQDTA